MSVLLWGWGEGGRAGSTRHQLACLPLGHRARAIRTIGQKLPDSSDGFACFSAGHRAGSTRHQLACLPLGQHASPTYRGTPRPSSCGVGGRGPCRINQAPTGVSPFGTPCFTYVQRYATSVLLWGWGEG